ncbi:transglutaminase domain-containing protein [Reichenbachiella agariperforans]|nr:transglutaminase domain-containing protein [Reichenbachiella agariperforans]
MMKVYCLLSLFFLALIQPLAAQIHTYTVDLNNTSVGSYQTSVHIADTIHTTQQLQLSLVTLQDSTSIFIQTRYQEDAIGQLLSATNDISLSPGDTIHSTYSNDSLITSLGDSSYFQMVLGPYGTQKVSQSTLHHLQDSIRFRTYSPDLHQVVTVFRTLTDTKVIRAQKYWVIHDSIAQLPAVESLYDLDFQCYASQQAGPFGKMEIRPTKKTVHTSPLLSLQDDQKIISSNIWLPDPKNINAIQLLITTTAGDTLETSMADNQFYPLPTDSLELAHCTESTPWINKDNLDLFYIADSLSRDLASSLEMAQALTLYCRRTAPKYPALALIRLARSIDLPARIVHGYYYQYGYWVSALWTEIGIDEEWQIFNPNSHSPINPSLYLPMVKSDLHDGLAPLFLHPKIAAIQTTNYLRNGNPMSSFESEEKQKDTHYENLGLGLSFDIPKKYTLTEDTTVKISPLLLELKNDTHHITLSYVTPTVLSEQWIAQYLLQHTGQLDISRNKYLNSNNYQAISETKAILVIPQGGSVFIWKFEGTQPENMIDAICKKNLLIKN